MSRFECHQDGTFYDNINRTWIELSDLLTVANELDDEVDSLRDDINAHLETIDHLEESLDVAQTALSDLAIDM
jgi:hypothetical protein